MSFPTLNRKMIPFPILNVLGWNFFIVIQILIDHYVSNNGRPIRDAVFGGMI